MNPPSQHLYEFGPFRLDTEAPLLWRAGEPVDLTPKALETLVVLVRRAGQLVGRADLIEAVWPDTVVEDNNLSVNISLLRKALGENEDGKKYIETISRRGYRFIALVQDAPVENGGSNNARYSDSPVLVEPATKMDADTMDSVVRAVPIAVLPFKYVAAQEGEDYLRIGLCDTLITRLSNLRRFAIRPTSSVIRYGDEGTEPLIAGRELKVDFVVDGRIRRAGQTLRVTVQLLSVSEEVIYWAKQFDQQPADVLQLEDSISEQIAGALLPRLTIDERERLAKRSTNNPEAFEAYLRGRYYLNSLTEDGFAKALADYELAVQLDPSYALAYTGIADAPVS